jgi:hypothetical protein
MAVNPPFNESRLSKVIKSSNKIRLGDLENSTNHSLAKNSPKVLEPPPNNYSHISQNVAPAFPVFAPACLPACSSAPFPYNDTRLLHLLYCVGF